MNKTHCNIICEYCEGCIDLSPKENYSCFRGIEAFYNSPIKKLYCKGCKVEDTFDCCNCFRGLDNIKDYYRKD